MRRLKRHQKDRLAPLKHGASSLLLIFLLLISFYPILWMILNAFKTTPQIYQDPLSFPTRFDFSIFATAWAKATFGYALTNSLFVAAVSVGTIVIVSSLAAYVLAMMDFKGRKTLYLFIISGQIVSVQIILIPLFLMLRDMGLLDHLWSVIIAYSATGIPLSVILFCNAFKEVPFDIYESARIDGSSSFRFYLSILIGITKPVFATVIIFQALFSWNEYLFALTFLRSAQKRTIPTAIPVFFAQFTTDYTSLFAILAIAVVPMLVLYLFMQKYFIKGLTAGAVKG